jgi:phage gpG-like protein
MSTVTGQDAVVRMMVTYREGIRPTLLSTMTTAAIDISGYIKDSKLSGQVLKVQSGRLRRSVSPTVESSGSTISAISTSGGTNVRYARPHEYGFQGTVNVSAHTRMQTMAFGRPMDPREVFVKAHPMKMNLPERSFMRSGLSDKAPTEIARVRQSMAELAAAVRQ